LQPLLVEALKEPGAGSHHRSLGLVDVGLLGVVVTWGTGDDYWRVMSAFIPTWRSFGD